MLTHLTMPFFYCPNPINPTPGEDPMPGLPRVAPTNTALRRDSKKGASKWQNFLKTYKNKENGQTNC